MILIDLRSRLQSLIDVSRLEAIDLGDELNLERRDGGR
jgi:hypothetical protein